MVNTLNAQKENRIRKEAEAASSELLVTYIALMQVMNELWWKCNVTDKEKN